ncbi:hypothetical protein BGX21_003725, partial [Mortierella sp. AD011]
MAASVSPTLQSGVMLPTSSAGELSLSASLEQQHFFSEMSQAQEQQSMSMSMNSQPMNMDDQQQQQYEYDQQLYEQEQYEQAQLWQQQQEEMLGQDQSVLSHDHLKPGHKATLLSYTQTLELYRQNAKKTNDPELQF